ncbi:MAG: hypothetical protein HY594_05585 [Candidatus Omnitrophica bacterium]|nr:hypothetical protein [Candidatus Omnitrophota bacterium]
MKLNKKRLLILEWCYMLALSLIPLIWFRHGRMLASLDTLLPQNWSTNLEFLHAWNHRLGTGTIHLFDQAAFLFNSLPALVLESGGSMLLAQQVTYCFWFAAAAWSMYAMMALLYPHSRIARLAAATFYACNFYVSPIWIGFNKPNIALYAVLPILTAWTLHLFRGEKPIWPTVGWIAGVSLAAASAGTNTPIVVLGGLVGFGILLYGIAWSIAQHRWKSALRTVWASGILLLLIASLHAFWWLPQLVNGLWGTGHQPLGEARAQALSYVEGISRHTSFWNVIRIQGDWTWYTGNNEPYVLHAPAYLTHPFWIVLSWSFVALLVLGILAPRVRCKKFFLCVALLGVVLSMGAHPPTGIFFRWAVNHLPGFWMFRSTWFKFMILTCLGFAFLVGVGAAWFVSWQKKQRGKWGAAAAILFMLLLYAHPVVTGTIFPTAEQRGKVPPLQFRLPGHVEEAAAWFRTRPAEERLFMLPGRGIWANTWGYPGFFSFLWYRIPQPLLYEMNPVFQMISQGASQASLEITRFIRKTLNPFQGDETPRLDRLWRLLGVRYVVHEKDYRYDLLELPDSPERMQERLRRQNGISVVKTFGPWEVYEVKNPRPLWRLSDRLMLVWGDASDFPLLSHTTYLEDEPLYWVERPEARTHLWLKEGLVRRILVLGTPPTHFNPQSIPEDCTVIVVNSSKQASAQPPTNAYADRGLQWQWGNVREAEEGWKWVLPDVQTLEINNPHPTVFAARMSFEIKAHRTPRRLYPLLNKQPVQVDTTGVETTLPIGAQPTRVTLPAVTLLPGRNHFQFYTTEPWMREGDQTYSFAVRDIVIGDPRLQAHLLIPREGGYALRLHPFYEGALTDREVKALGERPVWLNGTLLLLQPRQDDVGNWHWEAAGVPLRKGDLTFEAETFLGEGWVVTLENGPPSPPAAAVLALRPQRQSPTAYTLAFRLTQPSILVFNESYHPGWNADPWPHFRVNGFANAWLVPPGFHEKEVVFAPQKWSRLGQKISLVSTAILSALLGTTLLIQIIQKR